MAKPQKSVTLVHPDDTKRDREYTTSDAVEITNLKARGYTEKGAGSKSSSSKS